MESDIIWLCIQLFFVMLVMIMAPILLNWYFKSSSKNKKQDNETDSEDEEEATDDEDDDETYDAEITCWNCGDDGWYDDIPKSITREEYFKNKKCENCGQYLIKRTQGVNKNGI